MRSGFQKLAIASFALLGATALARSASASSGLDSPDSGVYQMGRGGAWIARADDPLAAYFNPAGLVRQASGVTVGAQMLFLNRCYARTGQDSDQKSQTYGQYGFPVAPAPGYAAPGAPADGKLQPPDASVCAGGGPGVVPTLAGNFRVLDSLAIGLAVVPPHGVGKSIWPETVSYKNKFGIDSTQPAPQRYMLTESDSIILFPTLSVAYAINDQISVGAGFVWGIAHAQFVNFAETLSAPPAGNTCGPNKDQPCVPFDDFSRDARAKLSATDIFVPGFVIGALYSPIKNLDVAGWFRWSDAVDTSASVHVEAPYWNGKGAPDAPCGGGKDVKCQITAGEKAGDPGFEAGHIKLNIPMEAKLGVRFHYPRQDPGPKPSWATGTKKVRDAMSEDLFDVEADFTYANNSAVKAIEVRFKPGIAINGTGGGLLPENADIVHNWKDVFGARIGGEAVILPSRLSARAGFFYESKGQDDQYLNIDFHLSEKIGLSGGASVRLGPVDITVAYQHTFFGALDNKGKGALYGLSGDGLTSDKPGAGGKYRTYQTINGGKLTSDLNEVGLGATMRF